MYELHLQIMPDQWIHHPSLPLYRRLPLPSGEARSKKPAAAAAAAKPPCQPSARRALSWCALARPMHNQADCAHSPDSPDLPPPPPSSWPSLLPPPPASEPFYTQRPRLQACTMPAQGRGRHARLWSAIKTGGRSVALAGRTCEAGVQGFKASWLPNLDPDPAE